MLSDGEIMKKITTRLKQIRLKQNMSQQDLAKSAGVSLSSVVRMEDGNVKSVDTFVRVLRTLGKLDVLLPLLEEEPISPKEYYELVNKSKASARKRASKTISMQGKETTTW